MRYSFTISTTYYLLHINSPNAFSSVSVHFYPYSHSQDIPVLCLNTTHNTLTMKFSLATFLIGLLPLAMARSIIVTYPKGTPKGVVDNGKQSIKDAVCFASLSSIVGLFY